MSTSPNLAAQIAAFSRDDYYLFPSAIPRHEVDAVNAVIDRHRRDWPSFWSQGARSQSVFCLLGMPDLDFLIRHPSFYPLASALLDGEIVFSEFSIMIRQGNQKAGAEGWHRDVGVNEKQRLGITALSAIYYLTDVDQTTARYSLVPGSHAVNEKPEPVAPGSNDYVGEKEIFAPAGSVLLVNAGIWHTGKWGTGPRERRTLHLYYQPSSLPQFSPHNIVPRRLWDVPDAEQRRFYSHFNPLTRAVSEAYAR